MNNQENLQNRTKGMMQKLLVGFIITLAVVVLAGFVYIYIRSPKTSELAESKLFSADKVYEESEAVIGLFEEADFAGMREQYCNDEIAQKMTDEAMEAAYDSFGGDWGSRVEISSKEGFEAKQSGKYYAMTQYKVKYENTELTYTLMFDTDMKLAGFSVEPKK